MLHSVACKGTTRPAPNQYVESCFALTGRCFYLDVYPGRRPPSLRYGRLCPGLTCIRPFRPNARLDVDASTDRRSRICMQTNNGVMNIFIRPGAPPPWVAVLSRLAHLLKACSGGRPRRRRNRRLSTANHARRPLRPTPTKLNSPSATKASDVGSGMAPIETSSTARPWSLVLLSFQSCHVMWNVTVLNVSCTGGFE